MVFCTIMGIGVISDLRMIFITAVASERDSKLWEVICEYSGGAIRIFMHLCLLIMRYRPFLPSKCHGSSSTGGLLGGGLVVSLSTERLFLDKCGIRSYLFVSFGFFWWC